jgi:hypothetical protein
MVKLDKGIWDKFENWVKDPLSLNIQLFLDSQYLTFITCQYGQNMTIHATNCADLLAANWEKMHYWNKLWSVLIAIVIDIQYISSYGLMTAWAILICWPAFVEQK